MVRVVFTLGTMSAAFFHLIAGVQVARRKSILLSASVGFLTGLGNSAAAVLLCADSHPTVVVRIHLLTVYHVYTFLFDTPVAVAAAMVWTAYAGPCVIFAGGQTGVR